ncbi:hypothetical protein PP707_06830, partial [Acetobacter pasteurianus]|nr:hypothetical protein [Acetobacter pasteurianus]
VVVVVAMGCLFQLLLLLLVFVVLYMSMQQIITIQISLLLHLLTWNSVSFFLYIIFSSFGLGACDISGSKTVCKQGKHFHSVLVSYYYYYYYYIFDIISFRDTSFRPYYSKKKKNCIAVKFQTSRGFFHK